MQLTILRIISWMSWLLLMILKPFFWYRDRVRPFNLPPSNNSLLNYTACELAKKIRLGQITSEAVIQAYIDRIKEVNCYINAVVEDRFEDALKEAKNCDRILQKKEISIIQLEKEKPFFGVPFSVKESCSLKGLSYTGCTLVRRGIKAEDDSLVVQSMRKAGAIPLCVTNTPELCSGLDSSNRLYGTTRNPYDGRHSAGGSSGGEGALLGAGGALMGIGSDLAGSIRVPALFNGVFGHKPTPGIIPIKGHFPTTNSELFQRYLVLGPMARYADDLHLAVKVMSADYAKKDLHLDEPVAVEKLKVYYLENIENNFGVVSVNSEIRKTIRSGAKYFESRGAKVLEANLPELQESCDILLSGLFNIPDLPKILIHPNNPDAKVSALHEVAKAFIGCSKYSASALYSALVMDMKGLIGASSVSKYTKKQEQLEAKLVNMLGNNGIFIYPTWVSAAIPIGQSAFLNSCAMYCILANGCGLPATQVPMGIDSQGLPIGFQVIAGPYQDRLCLAVAKELEKGFGGWTPPTKS